MIGPKLRMEHVSFEKSVTGRFLAAWYVDDDGTKCAVQTRIADHGSEVYARERLLECLALEHACRRGDCRHAEPHR